MFLIGNITGGSAQLRKAIRMNFDLIRVIENIIQTEKEMPKQFASNFVWIANNLAKDAGDLSPQEVQRLVNIFDIFIQAFTEENDEGKLVDIAQGLAALSKVQTEENLAVVAGMKH